MSLTKPTLDNLRATGTTLGDVNFYQVICLLPFEGSNTSTTFTDVSNNVHSINAGGDAQISTAQSKFGASSLYLDGSGDYVEMNSVASRLSELSAFTIEGWFKLPNSADTGILWAINSSSGGNVLWPLVSADSTIKFHGGGSSSSLSISPVNMRDGNWHHVAVTFDGTDYDLYVDGNRYHQNFTQSTALSSNDKIQIGMEYDSSSKGDYLQLYCNDFRISSIRRYTDPTYTVPTAAFLTSAGDVNKQILINSTADGVAIGTGGINQARVAKAWAQFEMAGHTVADSYNVSSITDIATGSCYINFSTSMSDANYVCATSSSTYSGSALNYSVGAVADTAARARWYRENSNGSGHDSGSGTPCSIVIFGN